MHEYYKELKQFIIIGFINYYFPKTSIFLYVAIITIYALFGNI